MKIGIGVKDFDETVRHMEASQRNDEQLYAKLLVGVVKPLNEIIEVEYAKGEGALSPREIANVLGTLAGTIISLAAVNFSPVPPVAYMYLIERLVEGVVDLPEVSAVELYRQGRLNE